MLFLGLLCFLGYCVFAVDFVGLVFSGNGVRLFLNFDLCCWV